MLRPNKHLVPTSVDLIINRRHPMTNGLVGAYLPGVSRVDFTGMNGQLTYIDTGGAGAACTGVPAVTTEGPSMGNSASTRNALATNPAGTISSQIASWSSQISCYTRFRQIGSAGSSNGGLFFITDATHSAIGISAIGATSNLYSMYSGGFNSTGAEGAAVSLGVHGFCISMLGNTFTSTMWLDGAVYLTATNMLVSACTLASTYLSIGGFSDESILALYFWNRSLTQTDAMTLESDPYGIFTSRSDDWQGTRKSSRSLRRLGLA